MPEPLRDWLRLAAERRVRLLGICTGTFALAQAGVVGPRTVCALERAGSFSRALSADPRRGGPAVHRRGRLDFCAGSTAAIDLGLYLVARHCGRDKAQQAMRHMMLQGVRPARAAGAFPQRSLRHPGSARQAGRAFHRAAHRQSAAAGRHRPLCRRRAQQLERAFRLATGLSPMAFQRQLRLEYGCWLLNKPSSITQVALDCGFADGAHFRATSARILAYPRVNICNPGRPSRANPIPLAVWRQSESIGFCLACMPVARRHIRAHP